MKKLTFVVAMFLLLGARIAYGQWMCHPACACGCVGYECAPCSGVSCNQGCTQEYTQCRASAWTPEAIADCWAQRSACLANCGGGTVACDAVSLILDQPAATLSR